MYAYIYCIKNIKNKKWNLITIYIYAYLLLFKQCWRCPKGCAKFPPYRTMCSRDAIESQPFRRFERINSIFFEELLVILKLRVQENSGCSTVTEILATDHQSHPTPPPPSSPTELYSSHLCSIFSSPLFWEQEIFGGKVRTEQWRVSGSPPLRKARERFHRAL